METCVSRVQNRLLDYRGAYWGPLLLFALLVPFRLTVGLVPEEDMNTAVALMLVSGSVFWSLFMLIAALVNPHNPADADTFQFMACLVLWMLLGTSIALFTAGVWMKDVPLFPLTLADLSGFAALAIWLGRPTDRRRS